MKQHFHSALHTTTGVLLSGAAALTLAIIGRPMPLRQWLPWIFVLVLIGVAARYGTTASLIGSVVGVVIFARRLYAPLGSIAVNDDAAKASLAWMALIAIVGSYLMYPPENQQPRH